MFAHDKLEVINDALMKCGLPLAASLDDCDWNAASVYNIVVEQLLRSFNWGFSGVGHDCHGTAGPAAKLDGEKSRPGPRRHARQDSVHGV